METYKLTRKLYITGPVDGYMDTLTACESCLEQFEEGAKEYNFCPFCGRYFGGGIKGTVTDDLTAALFEDGTVLTFENGW